MEWLARFAALAFLTVSLVLRAVALHAAGQPGDALVAAVVLVAGACAFRPALFRSALLPFGSTFLLFGFHSYRVQSQVFELAVVALALALLLSSHGASRSADMSGRSWIGGLWLAYGLLAVCSLLRLPPAVLRDRFFLEGGDLFRTILGVFPQDPLYPIAGVLRLATFVLFSWLLSRRGDARELYRALFRGVAVAALVAVVLGLLDFFGIVSLAPYNLSRVFYGAQYRRLQSTFGNPSWFACFVTCALPYVLLELWESRRTVRVALAALVPACAAALFLSGARAAWIACAALLALLAVVLADARRRGRPLPSLGRTVLVSFAVTLAGLAITAMWVYLSPAAGRGARPPATDARPSSTDERLSGLAAEMRIRGLNLRSPRSVAVRYALELARQAPLFGLGYETFSLHLRAQLAVPASRVAQVENAFISVDRNDALFDDAHDTYLQVLVGTGAVGLLLWLALAGVSLALVAGALRREPAPAHAAVFLALVVFHLYGLFQGMQYIPVTWFLLHAAVGYAMTLDVAPPVGARRIVGLAILALALPVLLSPLAYLSDRGDRAFRAEHGLSAYLPEEAAQFLGFYRPEVGPMGAFRWMARRAIIRITRPGPLRLLITCDQPGLDREPMVVSFRFGGRNLGNVVFRRSGSIEKTFETLDRGALRIESSRTLRPSSGPDRRERSVSISITSGD